MPRKIEHHWENERENSLRIGFPKTRADDPAPGPLSTLVREHDRPPTKKEYQGGWLRLASAPWACLSVTVNAMGLAVVHLPASKGNMGE